MTNDSSQDMLRFEETVAETNPVAVIGQNYTKIRDSNALHFQQSYDDLDELFFAILHLPSGNQVALVSHKHSPNLGTEICVSYGQPNIPSVILEAIHTLNLTSEDLSWVHSDYEQELYKLKDLPIPPKLDERVNYPQIFAGVDFSRCALKSIDLRQADLKKTIFKEANLSKANLQRADLREANLEQADLRSVKLQNANLQGANLKGADLRGANLSRANFQNANLEGANFQRANLRGTILNESNLDNASFKDADLENAHLYHIHWTTKTMWFHVIGLHKAIGIPEDLTEKSNFKYSVALSQGLEKLKHNNFEEFRNLYKAVITEIDDVEVVASLWNKFAWLSILYGYLNDESYEAAMKAVQLKEEQGNYHDTLGIIFALRNNFQLAIEEFETTLKSDDAQTWCSSFTQRREKWIQALRIGENPFTPEELDVLRRFEY